jgi:hypothetical protein
MKFIDDIVARWSSKRDLADQERRAREHAEHDRHVGTWDIWRWSPTDSANHGTFISQHMNSTAALDALRRLLTDEDDTEALYAVQRSAEVGSTGPRLHSYTFSRSSLS